MEIKGNLDNRLNSLITKLSPEESRRALRLFSKLSKITNFELEKLSEDSKTISSGLAQSVLYARGEKITSFKGLYAGAFITVKDNRKYVFEGNYAGFKSSFEGKHAGRGSSFEGDYAGRRSSFEGKHAGGGVKYKGKITNKIILN